MSLQELIDRHEELERLYNDDESERDLDAIGQEQDEIVEAAFAIVRDNLPKIRSALNATQRVIRCTHGVNENGEVDDNVEPKHSAADIVQMLCEIEGLIDDACQEVN